MRETDGTDLDHRAQTSLEAAPNCQKNKTSDQPFALVDPQTLRHYHDSDVSKRSEMSSHPWNAFKRTESNTLP